MQTKGKLVTVIKRVICFTLIVACCLSLCGCLDDGKSEYNRGYEEGYNAGYDQGYDDGRDEYEMKYDDLYLNYDDLKYNYDEYREFVTELAQAYANVGEDELADYLLDFVRQH